MTTATEIPAHRPGPAAWRALIAAESKMVMRDTAGLIIPLGLPLLILVMNGMMVQNEPSIVFSQYVMPLVLTMIIATIGVINMPSFLAYYRRSKVLRRLAVTPASPGMILASQVIVSALQSLVGVGLAVTVGAIMFELTVPVHLGATIGVFALASITMYAIGMFVAAVAPTGNASVAIGLVLFFGLAATGGMFGPTSNLPDPVAAVGEMLPFGAAVQAVGAAWSGGDIDPAHLIALVVATLVTTGIALKWFRWDS